MPSITLIKPQKNNKRVNVYLDEKFAFGLDLQTYLKSGLKIGQELSDEKVYEIVRNGNFQDAYDKILRFASIRPRSKKEYELWLKKHKVHESLYDKIFERLARLEFLDDKKFALWWIEQRNQFRPKSKRILSQELRMKGIKQDLIDEVLRESAIDEKRSARALLSKKERLWKNLAEYEKRQKMFSYLMRQGYSTEVVRDVLGELGGD